LKRIITPVETPLLQRHSTLPAVFLVRHGQTASNLEGRYAGYAPDDLTPLGRTQMEELAERLVREEIGEIWSSEVRRAQESAAILARRFGVAVQTEPRLNEMRLGPWEGLEEAAVAARFPEDYELWQSRPDAVDLEGRECLDAVACRVHDVLASAHRQAHPVVLVTHVAPIRVAALTLLGLPLRLYKRVRVDNGDCLVVNGTGERVRRLGQKHELALELSLAALAG
jgi:broad specificity phosphatase PhoE